MIAVLTWRQGLEQAQHHNSIKMTGASLLHKAVTRWARDAEAHIIQQFVRNYQQRNFTVAGLRCIQLILKKWVREAEAVVLTSWRTCMNRSLILRAQQLHSHHGESDKNAPVMMMRTLQVS